MKTQVCRPFDSRLVRFCTTDVQAEIYNTYGNCGSNLNATARELGRDVSTVSRAVRRVQEKGKNAVGVLFEDVGELVTKYAKVLIFDIETAPHSVYVWDFYNQNIGHDQVLEYGHVMSFAARWLGTTEVIYHECRNGKDKKLTEALMKLFDEADVVVGHNGRAFDVKTMKGRALLHELLPPTPYKVVDTFLIAKNQFKLPRNSLEFIAEFLGCKPKLKHNEYPGFSLWKSCLEGDERAWECLKEYNIGDIDTLEEVYMALRKWDTTHANLGIVINDTISICPKCASPELRSINPISTNTQLYPGFRCQNCGGICRGRFTIADREKRRALLVHGV